MDNLKTDEWTEPSISYMVRKCNEPSGSVLNMKEHLLSRSRYVLIESPLCARSAHPFRAKRGLLAGVRLSLLVYLSVCIMYVCPRSVGRTK